MGRFWLAVIVSAFLVLAAALVLAVTKAALAPPNRPFLPGGVVGALSTASAGSVRFSQVTLGWSEA